jgi:hypothetical protein
MKSTCRLLLSLFLCISGSSGLFAQDVRIPAPVAVTIGSLKSVQQLPQPKWMIKEGKTPLSIQDILEGDIKDGQVVTLNPDDKVINRFGKYWFAIEFISEVDLHNWLLYVKNPSTGFGYSNNFSEISAYHLRDGQLVHTGNTGFFIPASQRDFNGRHTQSLLNLNLSPGSRVIVWVHIRKNYTITSTFPQLTIYDPSITLPAFTVEGGGLFWLGTLLMIWILSVIISFYLRDRTSIWFFVFATALIVDLFTNMTTDPLTSVLYPENPETGFYMGLGASLLMLTCLLQFARILVNLRFKNRKLDRIMYLSVWFFLIASIVSAYLLIYYENVIFTKIFIAIFGIIYLGSGTAYLFIKDQLSRIMGLAILLFIIPNLIPLPIEYIPMSALLLTVTIGVGYRIKKLFQDKLHAEREKKDL